MKTNGDILCIDLIVTLNIDNLLGYEMELSYTCSMIENTADVLVCVSSDVMTRHFEICISMLYSVSDAHHGVAVVRDETGIKVPPMLTSFAPFVDVDLKRLCVYQVWTQDFSRETVKKILLRLAITKSIWLDNKRSASIRIIYCC